MALIYGTGLFFSTHKKKHKEIKSRRSKEVKKKLNNSTVETEGGAENNFKNKRNEMEPSIGDAG